MRRKDFKTRFFNEEARLRPELHHQMWRRSTIFYAFEEGAKPRHHRKELVGGECLGNLIKRQTLRSMRLSQFCVHLWAMVIFTKRRYSSRYQVTKQKRHPQEFAKLLAILASQRNAAK